MSTVSTELQLLEEQCENAGPVCLYADLLGTLLNFCWCPVLTLSGHDCTADGSHMHALGWRKGKSRGAVRSVEGNDTVEPATTGSIEGESAPAGRNARHHTAHSADRYGASIMTQHGSALGERNRVIGGVRVVRVVVDQSCTTISTWRARLTARDEPSSQPS
jgi:hypothetical protein